MTAQETTERSVYRIEGLSCANCAAKFEKNVKALPRVDDAQINFGASKLTVYGGASVRELEQAGAFDGLRVVPEREARVSERMPIWRRRTTWTTIASALLLSAGWLTEGGTAAELWYAAAIAVGGYALFWKGLLGLLRLDFTMNALMTVAIIGAAAIGEWSEGATVVILFALSEALEAYSMDKARASIRSLMQLAPKEAAVRRGGKELTVRAEDVRIGDVLLVRPGGSIAADGTVAVGQSAVNQAAITGESMPAAKGPGDDVFAGTMNGEGYLEIEVTKTAADTTLARIIHLVEEAQAEKAPAQAFVDRFAKWYTPAVMAAAFALAVVPPLFAGDWSGWLYRGLALLVVGCPCALVVSTPVALVTAIGNAARHGVLIKGGLHLEQLGRVKTVAFDKTGTLTEGKPGVARFVILGDGSETELLDAAAALERRSEHPLASAVVRYKEERRGREGGAPAVTEFASISGKGVQGKVNGVFYTIGSPSYYAETFAPLDANAQAEVNRQRSEGFTVIVLGTAHYVQAVFGIADSIREEAVKALAELRDLGIERLTMLTGDHRRAAEGIASRLGIGDVRAGLLPEAKLAAIRGLREAGPVAMVGDGVNDAPALATATVGIAMGGAGTDAALETADVALMGDDLAKLPYAIRVSRKTLVVIRQNIALALGLKLLAVILLVPDWLTLWLAIVADMGATLLVTLNSLRLLRIRN